MMRKKMRARIEKASHVWVSIVLVMFCAGAGWAQQLSDAVSQRGLFPLGAAGQALVLEAETVQVVYRPPGGVDVTRRYTIRNQAAADRYRVGSIICQNCRQQPDGLSFSIEVDGQPVNHALHQDRLKDLGTKVQIEPVVEKYLPACLKYPQGEICIHQWASVELDFAVGQQRQLTLIFQENESKIGEHLYLYSEKFWANPVVFDINMQLGIAGDLYPAQGHMPELLESHDETIDAAGPARIWKRYHPKHGRRPVAIARIAARPGELQWQLKDYRPMKTPYPEAFWLPVKYLPPFGNAVAAERLRQRLVGAAAEVVNIQQAMSLRSSPLESAAEVAKVKAGQQIKIRTISDDWQWYMIELASGSLGYIPSQQVRYQLAQPVRKSLPAPTVEPAPATKPSVGTVAIRGNNLRVRMGPGTEYPVVGKVAKGSTVVILKRSTNGQWYQVQAEDGLKGFCAAKFVRLSALTPRRIVMGKVATNGSSLRIRKRPGTQHPVLTEIANGADLRIAERIDDGKWYRVTLEDGRDGYAFGRFVQLSETAPAGHVD